MIEIKIIGFISMIIGTFLAGADVISLWGILGIILLVLGTVLYFSC